MKKFLVIGLVLFGIGCKSNSLYTVIEAQSLPIDVKVQWSPSVVDVNNGIPTGYKVTFDGVVKDEGLPPLNVACSCIQVIRTVTTIGAHTFSVIAYNMWGDSTPTVVNAVITVPNSVTNMKVTK